MVRGRDQTARARQWDVLVRGDSAYGTSAVTAACVKAKGTFLRGAGQNAAVCRAIAAIDEDGYRCTILWRGHRPGHRR